MQLSELVTRDDIGFVLNTMGLDGPAVEVGVAFGENAEVILHKSNTEVLFLVDPWAKVEGENSRGYADAIKDWEGCLQFCKDKLARFKKRSYVLRETSKAASEKFKDETLHFVYIDANHMSPYIDNDLKYWFDKVKPGGIFGGHDYHTVNRHDYQCDVKTAVDNFFKDKNYTLHVTTDSDPSWYIIK
jgi:Methyltransferase domain